MATRVEAARSLLYRAAALVDAGTIDHGLIAMAKWLAGETGVRVADEALQLHGGYGYLAENDVERLYRDAKIVETLRGHQGSGEADRGADDPGEDLSGARPGTGTG